MAIITAGYQLIGSADAEGIERELAIALQSAGFWVEGGH